jgi:uncharacterized membrane protein YgdD (TMEM256/DUF423 family)
MLHAWLKLPTHKGWIVTAAVSGAIAVIFGAFAAHGIDAATAPGMKAREWLQTASRYETVHALGMLAITALAPRLKKSLAAAALLLFLVGSVLFPGALYGLALGGPRWLGAVVPVGGLAFIAGWLSFALAAVNRTS